MSRNWYILRGNIKLPMTTAYCSAGEELGTNGKCEPCQRGFYKDNVNEVARFDKCTACPVNLITETNGATHQDDCTRGNISFIVVTLLMQQ